MITQKVIGRIIKICIFLLILAMVLTNIVHCFQSIYYLDYYKIEHFWRYKKDFTALAKFCLDQFGPELKENDALSHICIDYNITPEYEFQVTYYYHGDEEPSEHLVPIDETINKSFEIVKRAFREKANGIHNTFTHITVWENFVRFNTYGPYSITYSKYGTKPSLAYPIFFDKIRFRWYQAVKIYS